MSVPLRLLYGLNADGRPKRISMFPPSYADRARERAALRHQRRMAAAEEAEGTMSPASNPPPPPFPGMPVEYPHRSVSPVRKYRGEVIVEKDRIIVPRTKKAGTSYGNGRSVSKSTRGDGHLIMEGGPRHKSTSSQTDVTFCTHECGSHPRLMDHVSAPEPDKEKKGSKGLKEKKEGDGHPQVHEKKGRHKKGKTKQGKDDSDHLQVLSDFDNSSEEEAEPNKKDNRAGYQADKQRPLRAVKNADDNVWDPSKLPFLASLLPGTDKLSRQEKHAVEQHRREACESLAAARKADEEEARRWISQRLAATHIGALQWLRERDVRRQTTTANNAFFDPADLLAALGQADSHPKGGRVPFHQSGLVAMPDPNIPLWVDSEQDHIHARPGVEIIGTSNSAPFVVYQDNNRIYTADGRPVQVVHRSSRNNQSNTLPIRDTAPLQVVSGNPMRAPAHTSGGWPWKSTQGPTHGLQNIVNGWNQGTNTNSWVNNNSRKPNIINQESSEEWPSLGEQNATSNGLANGSWGNTNVVQTPQPPRSPVIVDEATGLAFHPAENATPAQFEAW